MPVEGLTEVQGIRGAVLKLMALVLRYKILYSDFDIDTSKMKDLSTIVVLLIPFLGFVVPSRWDRYLGMTAAMTQVPVPTARRASPSSSC